MNELRTKLANECKTRTKAYFDSLPPLPDLSTKNKGIATCVKTGNFGCESTTKSVVALVSQIIGEDISPYVYAPARTHPTPGVIITFLSSRIAPGKWIPSLCADLDGKQALFVTNYEDKEAPSSLSDEQVNAAMPPTDEQIDEYFEKMSIVNLRTIIGCPFGLDVVAHE